MKREIEEIVIKAQKHERNKNLSAAAAAAISNNDNDDDNVPKCLSFENEVDQIIHSTKQVFLTMPAKSAGSSLGSFIMDYCMKEYQHLPPNYWGWYFNIQEKVQEMMLLNVDIPSILVSHLGNPRTLLNLVKSSTDESLIVYIHRHEADRMISGLNQVGQRLCRKQFNLLEDYKQYVHIDKDDGQCVIDEQVFIEIVQKPRLEVRNNVYRALTCDVFDAVKDNRPNMIILNYKETDKLQHVLAKHHCPEVLTNVNFPVHINEAASKKEIMVKLKNEDRNVPLKEWSQERKAFLEFEYEKSNKDYTCMKELKKMEQKLFTCDNGVIRI